MKTQNKRLTAILLTIVGLLFIQFIAMQLSDEVNWSLFDFILAAVLLLGVGLTCELILRKVKTTKHRIVLCGVVLLALFLIWVELAVGLFGSPFAGS